jgi:hypothetical protein
VISPVEAGRMRCFAITGLPLALQGKFLWPWGFAMTLQSHNNCHDAVFLTAGGRAVYDSPYEMAPAGPQFPASPTVSTTVAGAAAAPGLGAAGESQGQQGAAGGAGATGGADGQLSRARSTVARSASLAGPQRAGTGSLDNSAANGNPWRAALVIGLRVTAVGVIALVGQRMRARAVAKGHPHPSAPKVRWYLYGCAAWRPRGAQGVQVNCYPRPPTGTDRQHDKRHNDMIMQASAQEAVSESVVYSERFSDHCDATCDCAHYIAAFHLHTCRSLARLRSSLRPPSRRALLSGWRPTCLWRGLAP